MLEDEEEASDGSTGRFKVFISYTRREGSRHMDRVEQLYKALADDRKLDVFKDDHKIVPGERLTPRLKEEIARCSLFVSMMSNKYFDSKWCYEEFEEALKGDKKIFPVVCDSGSGGKFQYPKDLMDKYKEKDLGDLLRHTFDCKDINEDAELAKCAREIIRFINKLRQGFVLIHYC